MQEYTKAIEEILKRGYTLRMGHTQKTYYYVYVGKGYVFMYKVGKDWKREIRKIYKTILANEEFPNL